ncbi:hypothetical protein [Brevundimonas viscosa]|uniref:hypothetical protein n=1 Tax=Brevundimonas viscosa TaxID=871741 RepID=UPI001160B601|nr:hypothetical protein [Brevundimonas viscosa]
MFTSIVALSLSGLAIGAGPLRMPLDDGMRRESVTAEYLPTPAGVAAARFAWSTVTAEGLTNANGGPPYTDTAPSGLQLVAIISGDGRAIHAVHRPGIDANHICVVRAAFNGAGPAAYRAKRWCAARFGIDLPEVRPPVIR